MASYALHLKAPHFNDLSRILCFILIGEKIAVFIFVITGIPFQRVLIVWMMLFFMLNPSKYNVIAWLSQPYDHIISAKVIFLVAFHALLIRE